MATKSENILSNYLPEGSLDAVMKILRSEPVELKIKNPRKTKFGDYRFPDSKGRHRISINSNLNSYAFLITLLHEMAHLKAFKQYGKSIKPHGKEWQAVFLDISQPFLSAGIFPDDLKTALYQSLKKGSASSCTDLDLFRTLKTLNKTSTLHVEDLEPGTVFAVSKDMVFKKGPLARKRYKCLNLKNGKEYMVHPLAEVKLVKPEKINKSA